MPPEKLFTPGPTAVPWQVLETMSRPLIHHRTKEFREIHREAAENLKYVYRTTNPVVILTASGSGAMEAAVANLTRVGEKAIVIQVGYPGRRLRAAPPRNRSGTQIHRRHQHRIGEIADVKDMQAFEARWYRLAVTGRPHGGWRVP